MSRFHILLVGVVCLVCIVASLYARRGSPVVYSFGYDVEDSQGKMLLNPFRDRAPEEAADRFLRLLSRGQCEAAIKLVSELSEPADTVCSRESAEPIKIWKISARQDSGDTVKIRYDALRQSASRVRGDTFWIVVDRSSHFPHVRSFRTGSSPPAPSVPQATGAGQLPN